MLAGILLALAGCEDCYHQQAMAPTEVPPYPSCEEGEGETRLIFEGHLRASEISRDPTVVERFRFEQRGCLYVFTGRQEWPRGTADLEVVFDVSLQPLRAWKRTTSPGVENRTEQADIRLYELRGDTPFMKVRRPNGLVEFFRLKGERPTAVVGPGRGLLSVWARRAKLGVGGKSAESVLDFRSLGLERIERIALRRNPDRFEESIGQEVRVYTVYGRESVFLDQEGVVIGDLAGLREADTVSLPVPPAIPMGTPPDPVNTP